MTEVRRYGGRTYAKTSQPQDSSASKAFDEVFAKPMPTKWGNVSYVKPRVDSDGVDKKVKTEADEEEDPFSFETDQDRVPKKRQTKIQRRTVVMQPAVRITSSMNKPVPSKPTKKSMLDDEDDGFDVLTVKKGNARTYSKRAGRTIKQEPDSSPVKTEPNDFHSTDSSKGTPQSTSEPGTTVDLTDDTEDGLYIEPDDGSSSVSAQDEIFSVKEEKEEIFHRPKQEIPPVVTSTQEGEEIRVRFRSPYLNPEVYSKFTENVKPKDPVGSLSNSKVVHKNVLKHDSGTTLIVVCSPKVGDSEIKQSNTQSKYFKDNVKDLAKSKKKTVERLTRGKRGRRPVEKDPFEMDDDPDYVPSGEDSPGVVSERDSESPGEVPVQEENQVSEPERTRSGRLVKQEVKQVNVDEIVKTVKTAPPRKYHRIFRSRNKGYMDPRDETEENQSQEQPNNGKSEEAEEAKPEELVEGEDAPQESTQENGESESTEQTGESEPMETESSQGMCDYSCLAYMKFQFIFMIMSGADKAG